MHIVLKVFGAVTAAIGAILVAIGMFDTWNGAQGLITQAFLPIGVSALVSGATLYALGAIVGHLSAMQKMQERQLAIFERMGQERSGV